VLGAGGWLVEAVGVTTGVPFGAYRYTNALGPWLGPVPAAIPFAWIAGVGAAVWTARRLLRRRVAGLSAAVLLGATLATLQDAVLEPTVTQVQGYWRWLDPAGSIGGALSYGVPAVNFAGWFGAALLLGGAMSLLLRPIPDRLHYGWLPPVLYCMGLFMFGILDAAWGFTAPAALATLLLAGFAFCWRLR